jgi:hypothetical protein
LAFISPPTYKRQLLIPYSGTPLSGVGQQTITAIPQVNKVWGIFSSGGLTAIVLDVVRSRSKYRTFSYLHNLE